MVRWRLPVSNTGSRQIKGLSSQVVYSWYIMRTFMRAMAANVRKPARTHHVRKRCVCCAHTLHLHAGQGQWQVLQASEVQAKGQRLLWCMGSSEHGLRH